MESRTKKTMRNLIVSFLMQLVTVALSFACRTVFARLLSAEYLGLGGLFTNIISVLSLSELGLGSVIIVNLYKPLAENDQERISRLMNFYKAAYTIIGVFVIVCGIIIAPFLNFIVKSESEIPYLKWYFLLFILQSAASYFFSYKQTLLTASQSEYICSIVRQIFNILMNGLQILFLILTKQYFTYLVVSIITTLGTNIVLSINADKKFPYIKNSKWKMLVKTERKRMYANVSSMLLHKVGNVVINGTDSLLISSFIGIIYAGLYSNYLLIINAVTQIVTMGFNAVSASIGDYNANKSVSEVRKLFNVMSFLSCWLFGMCAVCFCVLFQPTIKVWLGEEFLLDNFVVLILSLNFFISGILRVPSTFIDVAGLYVKTKFKPLSMAIINLLASLVFMYFWGLVGVFIGTLFSYVFVGIWVDPYVLYKHYFKSSVIKYALSLLINCIAVIVVGVVTYLVVQLIANYILKVVICFVLSNVLMFGFYAWRKEFKFILGHLRTLFKKKNVKEEADVTVK